MASLLKAAGKHCDTQGLIHCVSSFSGINGAPLFSLPEPKTHMASL